MRLLSVLALLVVPVLASAQTATPGQSFAWSAPQAAAELVTRFELKIDTGPYVDVGLTPRPGSPGEYMTPIPALTTGEHTAAVRACNEAGCSPDLALTFVMVAGVPAAPTSLGIIPTP